MRTQLKIATLVVCAALAAVFSQGVERQASASAGPVGPPPPATVSLAVELPSCASARSRLARLDRQIVTARALAGKARTGSVRRAAKKRLGRLLAARRQAVATRTSACRAGRLVPPPTIATPTSPAPAGSAPPAVVGGVTTPGTITTPAAPAVPDPPDPTRDDSPPPVPAPGMRATADRPDVRSGPLFHVIYVVPKDVTDRRRDADGQIAASVTAGQEFLEQAGAFRLKLDTYGGQLDVSFIRTSTADAEAAQQGPYVLDLISEEVHAAGFNDPEKFYLVYYEGLNTAACGSAPWPAGSSSVAALYLHGEPNGFPCDSLDLVGAGEPAGYWEHSLVHEAVHLQGMVPSCAPSAANSTPGHVGDSPKDLMYAGPLRWVPDRVDVGNDDYYEADVPGCPDLSNSRWIER